MWNPPASPLAPLPSSPRSVDQRFIHDDFRMSNHPGQYDDDDDDDDEDSEQDRPIMNRNRLYGGGELDDDDDDDDNEEEEEEPVDDFQDYLDELYEREWEEYMQRMMGEMMTGDADDDDNYTAEKNDIPSHRLSSFFNELHSNYPFYEEEEEDGSDDEDDKFNPFLRRDPVSGEEKIDHDLLLLMTKLLLGEKLIDQDENYDDEESHDEDASKVISTVTKNNANGQNSLETTMSNPRRRERRPTYWTIQAAIQRAIDNSNSVEC
jgi:hypothetical protein